MYGRGHAWGGASVAGKTATVGDGTHPTGTHSCLEKQLRKHIL